MSNEYSNNRIQWIDTARFIAIILVIIGHNETFGNIGRTVIWSVHMPVFFVISGFLFKKRGLVSGLRKGFFTYLIPYLCGVILCVLFGSFFHEVVFGRLGFHGYDYKEILTTSLLEGNGWGTLWFLPCLFVTVIIMEMLFLVDINECIRAFIVLALNVIGVFFFKIQSYFEIRQAIIAVLFVYVGYLYRRYIYDKNQNNTKFSKINKIIPIICGIIWVTCVVSGISLDMNTISYRPYPLTIISAICGTYVIVLLSMKLPTSNVILFLGSNTLIMYLIHSVENCFIPWSAINGFIAVRLGSINVLAGIITAIIRVAMVIVLTYITISTMNYIKKIIKER